MAEQDSALANKKVKQALNSLHQRLNEFYADLKEKSESIRHNPYKEMANVAISKDERTIKDGDFIKIIMDNFDKSVIDEDIYTRINNVISAYIGSFDFFYNDIKNIVHSDNQQLHYIVVKTSSDMRSSYAELCTEILLIMYNQDIINKIEESKIILDKTNESKKYIESIMNDYGIRLVSMASSKHFEKEASFYYGSSITWITLSIFMFIVTIAVAYNLMNFEYVKLFQDQGWVGTLYPFLSKISIIGILIAGTTWCAKMHSRARHNYALNTHRANSLSTAALLIEYAKDNQSVSNFILHEATRSAFSPIETGYIKSDAGTSLRDVLKVVDSLKGVVPSKTT